MAERLLEERCAQCGQLDDHPKVHVNPDTPTAAIYHYDCLPFDLRDASEYVAKAVELANKGTKGDKLRSTLQGHFKDRALPTRTES